MKIKMTLLTISLALALLASLALPGLTRAQGTTGYIRVNTTTDEVNSDADCSLREAVIAAMQDRVVSGCAAGSNTATDQITFDFPGTGDIFIGLELTSDPESRDAYFGDLDLTQSVTISGAPNRQTVIYIVHGSPLNDRVFHVKAPAGTKVILRNLVIRNGRPGTGDSIGGGIFNESGSLGVESCLFDSNKVFAAGGAIYNNSAAAGADLTVVNSEFISNSASRGGAVFNYGVATITNSYFLQNNSTDDQGSGGAVYHNSATEKLTLLNNTFYQNDADVGAEVFSDGGSMEINNNTIVGSGAGSAVYIATNSQVRNTIILQRGTGKTCAFPSSYDPNNPPLVSTGHNLESQNLCHLRATGDQVAQTGAVIEAEPGISHGGTTDYFWLPEGSPAINAGANCVSHDQRGFFWSRPASTCDMGSIELEAKESKLQIYLPTIRFR